MLTVLLATVAALLCQTATEGGGGF
eukprot:COSAG06_NODE_52525_length_305_cov_0.742718_1_plen_24_part_01